MKVNGSYIERENGTLSTKILIYQHFSNVYYRAENRYTLGEKLMNIEFYREKKLLKFYQAENMYTFFELSGKYVHFSFYRAVNPYTFTHRAVNMYTFMGIVDVKIFNFFFVSSGR